MKTDLSETECGTAISISDIFKNVGDENRVTAATLVQCPIFETGSNETRIKDNSCRSNELLDLAGV